MVRCRDWTWLYTHPTEGLANDRVLVGELVLVLAVLGPRAMVLTRLGPGYVPVQRKFWDRHWDHG